MNYLLRCCSRTKGYILPLCRLIPASKDTVPSLLYSGSLPIRIFTMHGWKLCTHICYSLDAWLIVVTHSHSVLFKLGIRNQKDGNTILRNILSPPEIIKLELPICLTVMRNHPLPLLFLLIICFFLYIIMVLIPKLLLSRLIMVKSSLTLIVRNLLSLKR